MKKVLFLAALLLAVVSCKKTLEPSASVGSPYFQAVIAQLRDSLSSADFEQLDTSRGYLDTAEAGKLRFFRIGFRGVSVAQSFVLLRTDDQGNIIAGRLVNLTNPMPSVSNFDPGSLTLRSLGGTVLIQSQVVNGYVLAFHPGLMMAVGGKKTLDIDEDGDEDGDWETLPEAIVTPGGDGGGVYYDFSALMGGGSDGGSYYGIADPSGVGGGGGGGVASPVVAAEMVEVPAEYSNNLTVVSVTNFMNCFTQVPDIGATYVLQLCTDIPVNNDPTESFDLSSGGLTVGHSFLVMTKISGTQSVTQCFGFYPAATPSFWSPTSSLTSAIKDNGNHEINASITVSLSASQFQTAQAVAIINAGNQYNIASYNCTNYALSVFNSVVYPPVDVPPFNVYINTDAGAPPAEVTIPQSPEGLYTALTTGTNLSGLVQTSPSGSMLSPLSHGQCP